MTTPTKRTPQQASIEAKEAREAWENGAQVECKWKDTPWDTYRGECPLFADPFYSWRPKPPTPTPVITPGKWRTRGGEVVTIASVDENLCRQAGRTRTWYIDGHASKIEHPHAFDLISRVETKWRSWRPEEVPVGSVTRYKIDHEDRRLLINVGGACERQEWFNKRELLLPDGTYSPCGVEEEVG